jgi:hypothetical protein
MTMSDEKKTDIEEAIEELFTDPDAPQNSDTRHPPQTIDAEPSAPDKDAR